eukprot:297949-Chlamydomonas_euryale.AAC.1
MHRTVGLQALAVLNEAIKALEADRARARSIMHSHSQFSAGPQPLPPLLENAQERLDERIRRWKREIMDINVALLDLDGKLSISPFVDKLRAP